jgi:hypothetical protein
MPSYRLSYKRLVLIAVSLSFVGALAVFNLFKREYLPLSQYPDTWGVSEGVIEGRPVFLRYRTGFSKAVGHPKYGFQIGVATPLLTPTEHGLTREAEAEELWALEDALDNALTQNDEAGFALSITTNEMREFVFYASEWKPEYFENKVKEINKRFPKRELQFMMQEDPNWNSYRSVAK